MQFNYSTKYLSCTAEVTKGILVLCYIYSILGTKFIFSEALKCILWLTSCRKVKTAKLIKTARIFIRKTPQNLSLISDTNWSSFVSHERV